MENRYVLASDIEDVGQDICSVYNVTDMIQTNVYFNHREMVDILTLKGYFVVKMNMMVNVNHKKSEGVSVETVKVTDGTRPVYLAVKDLNDLPKSTDHLNDHKDKFYFDVIKDVIKEGMRNSLINS